MALLLLFGAIVIAESIHITCQIGNVYCSALLASVTPEGNHGRIVECPDAIYVISGRKLLHHHLGLIIVGLFLVGLIGVIVVLRAV